MVQLSKRLRDRGSSRMAILAALCLLAGLFLVLVPRQHLESYLSLSELSNTVQLHQIALNPDQNAAQIKHHRKELRDQCAAATSKEQVEALGISKNEEFFRLPSQPVPPQPRDPNESVIRCKNVILDFGANIGDTLGKVIDTGLVGCDRSKDLGVNILPQAFDTETHQFKTVKRRNALVRGLLELMTNFAGSPLAGPEDYCYYGIEGNPVFTERLQTLEDVIMSTSPRPVQHAHFFTESVGTGQDGPTQLFLDTVNTKQNFWGSSIMNNHQDVRKSAANSTTGEKVAANVMGYTLGTLLRKTLLALDPQAAPEQTSGGHVILKIDIEGGEYPLVVEAAKEGTICQFAKANNKVDLFVEFHSQKVTGPNPLFGAPMKEAQAKLAECGATVQRLQASWH